MKPVPRRGGSASLSIGVYDEPELVVSGVGSMLSQQADVAVRLLEAGEPGRRTGRFDVDIVICDPVGRTVPIEAYLDEVTSITQAPVIVFTWSNSLSSVRRTLAAGARGFVSKSASAADLAAAVRAVHRGEQVTPTVTAAGPGEPLLSQRESEVLDLICRGLSNLEIGDELFVSVNSVKTYVRQVYQKIGVTRRSQAVAWGLAHGY